MSKNEDLRLLLASLVDYQVIRDDHIAEIPVECAVMHTISLNKTVYSGYREIEKTNEYTTEQTARRVEAYLQFDFYASTQARAEEMANNMLDVIFFKNRHDLVRKKFGLSDDNVEVVDRTFLEGSQYIYRFGFDINMNWREISQRKRKLIRDIDYETEAKNG